MANRIEPGRTSCEREFTKVSFRLGSVREEISVQFFAAEQAGGLFMAARAVAFGTGHRLSARDASIESPIPEVDFGHFSQQHFLREAMLFLQ